MRIRVRLGAGLSRFADAPQLSIDLADGASTDDLLVALGAQQPSLEPEARGLLSYARELYAG